MESEVRELSDEALVDNVVRTSLNQLHKLVEKGKNVPMSEFTKLMIWAKEQKSLALAKQLEKDRKEGWKIEERTWCGIPYNEFEIPSLHLFKS